MPQILWGSTQEFWQFKVSLRVSQLTLTKNFQPVHEINGINHHRLHWARWKVSKKWVFFSISDGISQKLFAVQVWLKIEVSLKELQRMRERTLGNLWVYSANFWTKKPPKEAPKRWILSNCNSPKVLWTHHRIQDEPNKMDITKL